MNKNGNAKSILFSIMKYLIIGCVISCVTILICYFAGAGSTQSMSNILTYVGAGILAVGFCGIMGTQRTATDLNYTQNAQSVGNADSGARLKQNFDLINGAYGFMIKAVIVSVAPFVLSIIIF
jgi:hypothetical protein